MEESEEERGVGDEGGVDDGDEEEGEGGDEYDEGGDGEEEEDDEDEEEGREDEQEDDEEEQEDEGHGKSYSYLDTMWDLMLRVRI